MRRKTEIRKSLPGSEILRFTSHHAPGWIGCQSLDEFDESGELNVLLRNWRIWINWVRFYLRIQMWVKF